MHSPEVNLLNDLNKYMLTEDRIHQYLSYSIHNNINNNASLYSTNTSTNTNTNKDTSLHYIKTPKNTFFIPKQKDTLFWCFYVMVHGINKYENMENINIVIEKTLKIEYVEKLRKKKDLLKTHKCASLLHIENMLVNEYKIDMKTFLALCVFENKNTLFIKKKMYYELEMNSLDEIHIVHFFQEKNKYQIEIDNSKTVEYRNSLYKITNIEKPIKAISSYKSEDLIEISKKIGIEYTNKETGKTLLKKDLYEFIIQYFS